MYNPKIEIKQGVEWRRPPFNYIDKLEEIPRLCVTCKFWTGFERAGCNRLVDQIGDEKYKEYDVSPDGFCDGWEKEKESLLE